MTQVVAVVQARMGSNRFPGKMLATLGDSPLIDWVLSRVLRASCVDRVILATSTSTQDEELAEHVKKFDVRVVRGSENDVLLRFVQALDETRSGLVVRVCADNPFIAPEEIDRLVNNFKTEEFDYSCNHQQRLNNNYADGFGAEILSIELLRKISALATEPSHREHVTSYLWDHQSDFRINAVEAPSELAFPEVRLDIDSPDDLSRLDTFVKQFAITTDSSANEILRSFRKFIG